MTPEERANQIVTGWCDINNGFRNRCAVCISDQIREAVAAETERCARLTEALGADGEDSTYIAAAIRAGTEDET